MKLLIVDDSFVSRKAIQDSIIELGLEIVGEAHNGDTALEIFQQTNPDIVTMDITMAGMNGVECIEKMNALDPEVRILVVSSVTDESVLRDAVTKGARGYVSKPFKKEDLARSLKVLM